jgi:hypothetical protein
MSKLALVIVFVGLVALSAPSWGQQSSGSSQSATGLRQQTKPAAARKPSPKPVATARRAATWDSDTMRLPQTNNWSIQDALPRESRAVRAPVPERSPLSRVPLEGGGGGSLGFDSISDSKPPPGQEVYGQRSTSYVGMSLSVPSLNKALPTLLPSPTGRSEW